MRRAFPLLGLALVAACSGRLPACEPVCEALVARAQTCVDGGDLTWRALATTDAADLRNACTTWQATARTLSPRVPGGVDRTTAWCDAEAAALPARPCDALPAHAWAGWPWERP